MNFGTKLRTALRVATSLQTAAIIVSTAIADLHIGWLVVAWAIFSIACDFAVGFLTTYFNNDYTQAGREGTGHTRYLKSLDDENQYGEEFESDDAEEYVEGEGYIEEGDITDEQQDL